MIAFLTLLLSAFLTIPAYAISICEVTGVAPDYSQATGFQVPCSIDAQGNMRTTANVSISAINATITNTASFTSSSASSVQATITNTPSIFSTITNTPSVLNATGTNTMGAVLQGTTPWTISGAVQATVTNPLAVQTTITNTPSILATITSNPAQNATITNASIPVTQGGAWAISATVTSLPAIQATITNTLSQFATITNTPSLFATVTSVPGINATVVNTASTTEIGIVATSLGTGFANGTQAPIMVDKLGRSVTVMHEDRTLATFGSVTFATSAEVTLLKQAGANTFWDLSTFACSNAIASTATRIALRATPAGIAMQQLDVSPGTTVVLPFFVPLPQMQANATWTIQPTPNATITCSFVAIQNK